LFPSLGAPYARAVLGAPRPPSPTPAGAARASGLAGAFVPPRDLGRDRRLADSMHTLAAATIYRRWSEPPSVYKPSNRPCASRLLGRFACSSPPAPAVAETASSRTSLAAAPTSSALVIGRPTTIRVAPAAMA